MLDGLSKYHGDMGSTRRVPDATVARLPVYLRALADLSDATVSSESLAAKAGVNAAQVRKDLSHLGSYGTRGVGYDVDYLVRQINRELGLVGDRRVAIVGAGNLGRALAGYRGFAQRGFQVVAALDSDPATYGLRLGPVSVEPFATIEEVLRREKVDMVILTTPASVAQEVADRLVAAGVSSILNFAPTVLRASPNVFVRQVDLGVELQILSYYAHQARTGAGAPAGGADSSGAAGAGALAGGAGQES